MQRVGRTRRRRRSPRVPAGSARLAPAAPHHLTSRCRSSKGRCQSSCPTCFRSRIHHPHSPRWPSLPGRDPGPGPSRRAAAARGRAWEGPHARHHSARLRRRAAPCLGSAASRSGRHSSEPRGERRPSLWLGLGRGPRGGWTGRGLGRRSLLRRSGSGWLAAAVVALLRPACTLSRLAQRAVSISRAQRVEKDRAGAGGHGPCM